MLEIYHRRNFKILTGIKERNFYLSHDDCHDRYSSVGKNPENN